MLKNEDHTKENSSDQIWQYLFFKILTQKKRTIPSQDVQERLELVEAKDQNFKELKTNTE